MSDLQNSQRKIQIGGAGRGEVSEADIEKRAAEIARIEARGQVTEADRDRAVAELTGSADPSVAPELPEIQAEDVIALDEPLDASGHRAERIGVEGDSNIAEQLVQEGIEQAEHDRRLSALDRQDEIDGNA
jgi:hypothetical protein